MSHNPQHMPTRQAAFTLIEVLLALALTTVVLTVTGQIAVQSLRSRRQAAMAIDRIEREALLFGVLAEDFANIIHTPPGDRAPLMVFGHQRQVLQLSALSSIATLNGDLHLIIRPATVRYRLVRHGDEMFDLIREVIDSTTPAAKAARETLASNVAGFDVEVLCDGMWGRSFPLSGDSVAAATAVRVSCRWGDKAQTTTRMFLVPHGK